jgi:non-ribosomal peptide synthase protein (TIGR01720 family)
VLRLERVGIHDNFFELGGDSILSIQIVARAKEFGIQLTPKQLFVNQTVAEQAAVATLAERTEVEQGIVTGDVPLTPIQSWFLRKGWHAPEHFNQAMMLEVRSEFPLRVWEQAIRQLMEHHDALRLRFHNEKEGWRQTNADASGHLPFTFVDLSDMTPAAQLKRIAATAEEVQASLSLSEGPIARFVLFACGAEQNDRLLIAIHHLAVDGVSWRILLEDLQRLCEGLKRSQEPVALPAKTWSFRRWARALKEYAQSDAVRAELDYWLGQPWDEAAPIPMDHEKGANSVGSTRDLAVTLDETQTRQLLQETPAAYNTQINDILLSALARTITAWTGGERLLLHLEGHGREEVIEGADLSRTVGWFTAMYPVILEGSAATEPGETIKRVKERLRGIPGRGLGYGLLRHMREDRALRETLRRLPRPQLSFNYLGQFDQVMDGESLFRPAGIGAGPQQHERCGREHLIDINASVVGGRLRIAITYSRHRHRAGTIEALAENYRRELLAIIEHCRGLEASSYTPSDFPELDIAQDDLDKLLAEYNEIEERT